MTKSVDVLEWFRTFEKKRMTNIVIRIMTRKKNQISKKEFIFIFIIVRTGNVVDAIITSYQ